MGKGAGGCTQEIAGMGSTLQVKEDLPLTWNSKELNITYVDSPEAMKECLEALHHPDVTRVGLDIETTGGLKPWHGTTRLIQIGVELPEPRQFLIDCWALDPSPVFPLLEDPQVEVVTHNGSYEQNHLYYRYGIVLANQWDTCYASRLAWKIKGEPAKDIERQAIRAAELPHRAKLRELTKNLQAAPNLEERTRIQRQIDREKLQLKRSREEARAKAPKTRTVKHSFKAVMRRYLNKQISKEQQTSAWDDPNLSEAQCRYAAMDVAGLLDVRRAMGKEIEERGLDEEVQVVNRAILDRSLEELSGGEDGRKHFDRLARALANARSAEQLDALVALQGQVTLHHTFRQKVQELYQRRLDEIQG